MRPRPADPLAEAQQLVHERPEVAQALALVAIGHDLRNVRDVLRRLADTAEEGVR